MIHVSTFNTIWGVTAVIKAVWAVLQKNLQYWRRILGQKISNLPKNITLWPHFFLKISLFLEKSWDSWNNFSPILRVDTSTPVHNGEEQCNIHLFFLQNALYLSYNQFCLYVVLGKKMIFLKYCSHSLSQRIVYI